MTEKRFILKYINEQHISANLYDNGTFIGSIGIGEELILELLNDLSNENEQLKKENNFLRCTIESNSQDDYIDYLEKQNERLKERITELASNDKIVFMNG